MMKRLVTSFIAMGAMAFAAASAEAACSKTGLNGIWAMEVGGTTFNAFINNGQFYFVNDKFTISSLSGSTCRGSGTFLDASGPTTYPAKFALEASTRDATGKGNRLIAAFTTDGGTTYVTYVLTRR